MRIARSRIHLKASQAEERMWSRWGYLGVQFGSWRIRSEPVLEGNQADLRKQAVVKFT